MIDVLVIGAGPAGCIAATVLARVNGKSVGFIANNPMFKGGALDPDACQKATSFMVLASVRPNDP